MAVFLSPGVYTRETDLSVVPTALGPLRPSFVGAAKKGPVGTPTLISTAEQFLEVFGEPFPESYLGYAVLAYLEEGNQCYVQRVAVECQDGQTSELSSVCVDTSGARGAGWGRIPLFSGIDFGRITLRAVSSTNPLVFHNAAVENIQYNDAEISSTNGATTATLNVTGTYTGSVDDTFALVITSAPNLSESASVSGAGYQIIRNSDGEVVSDGTLTDDGDNGTSQIISIGSGLSVQVVVTAGEVDVNDTFTFSAKPNNRSFSISVDGDTPTVYTMPAATYNTVTAFVDAANTLVSAADYLFIEYTLEDGVTVVPQIRTSDAGKRVQILTTQAWSLEVGTQQYAYDIPKSHLIGLDASPYNINSSNNRVRINVIGSDQTQTVELSVPSGNLDATTVANVVDAASSLWNSFAITVPGGTSHVVVESSEDLSMLAMSANYSYVKTLRFAEELGISYPYQRAYRGFSDNRTILPDGSVGDSSIPLSCEDDPQSDECAVDTAYYSNVVGWLVAPTPGTWTDQLRVTLSLYTEGVGDSSGRYKVLITNATGQILSSVTDVNFDKTSDRYIGNVVNPGTKYGGTSGDSYVNWEERPSYLDNDPTLSSYQVRLPSQFGGKKFVGGANGIPLDADYSGELDAAVIGNPSTSTGLYAFQNPETIDTNLLITPGFTSGAVIATALQICENRGDMLYIVDSPFGLRPQQVVDWHNGMLLSEMQSAVNSSYGALYWGWLRTYDQFNNIEIWVPPSGHVAAVFSRTSREAEQWFAPAGLRRGRLITALDVEYSPSVGERDLLYGSGNAVNPIVKFPQDGIVVYGQRTLQRTDSALNRVNVRMLMAYIKKNLSSLLRSFIFEPNDRILRRQVAATVEPFMGDIQSRRGIVAYKVVVDESNNTPQRIDRNELWVSVFVQPTKTVEFVVLNLAVLRTGSSFSSEEVLAAGGISPLQTAT